MWLAYLLIGILAISLAQEGDKFSVTLTNKNFNETINKFNNMLVMYHTPWCGHCQRLKPEFESAAQQMMDDFEINFGTVDCNIENEICAEIDSYPTLKFFKKQDFFEYSGGRTANEIVYWIRKKLQGGSFQVSKEQELLNHLKHNSVVVVYFSMISIATPSLAHFQSVANEFQTILFLHIFDVELRNKYCPNSQIALFAHHLEQPIYYPSGYDISEQNLINFIESNRYPNVLNFDIDSANLIFNGRRNALTLFHRENDIEQIKQFEALFPRLDKDQILLLKANVDDEPGAKLANVIGIYPADIPTVRIIQPEGDEPEDILKFTYEEKEIETEKLFVFVERYFEGKLKVTYKSEQIPENDVENGLKIIVGKTFDQFVHQKNKHILIVVYALWEQKSKQVDMVQILEQLVRENELKGLIIGKMEGTVNEVAGFKFSESKFPILLYYDQQYQRKPIQYAGNLLQEEIKQWILKQNDSINKIDL